MHCGIPTSILQFYFSAFRASPEKKGDTDLLLDSERGVGMGQSCFDRVPGGDDGLPIELQCLPEGERDIF